MSDMILIKEKLTVSCIINVNTGIQWVKKSKIYLSTSTTVFYRTRVCLVLISKLDIPFCRLPEHQMSCRPHFQADAGFDSN